MLIQNIHLGVDVLNYSPWLQTIARGYKLFIKNIMSGIEMAALC